MAGTDLISRAEAIARATHEGAYGYISAQELAELPSAERKGHWYDKNEGIWNVGMVMACSNCGESFYEMPIICGEPTYNYCPNCGARMKGEEE